MKLKAVVFAAGIVMLTLAVCASAGEKQPKTGPLTGTWECTAHGFTEGDLPFTLMLEQNGEQVTGSVESPKGGIEIASATFKNKRLDIQIDTPDGSYHLTGLLKDGKLSGQWAHDPEKGNWEGSKQESKLN